MLAGNVDRLQDAGLETVLIVDDPHRPAAQNEGGPNQQREPELARDLERLLVAGRGAAFRLEQPELLDQLVEPLAVLGQVDAVGRGADDLDARLLQGDRQFQRGLAAELDDDAVGLLLLHDGHHVLERQRLEVQPVGRVVVRADRLRVAVDHDGLDADLAQGHRRMNAAVIELDALADAVGPAAQDDDLAAVRRIRLALALVSRVQVRRGRLELRPARVHHLIDAVDAERLAMPPELQLRHARDGGQVLVAEAVLLRLLQQSLAPAAWPFRATSFDSSSMMSLMLSRNHGSILVREKISCDRHVPPQGLRDVPQLVPAVLAQLVLQLLRRERPVHAPVVQARTGRSPASGSPSASPP